MTHQDDKKGISPKSAGIAGAVIGAAVGAAAVALADKENRKKVEKTVTEMKKIGEKQFSRIKKYAHDRQQKGQDIAAETTDDIKDQTKKTDTNGVNIDVP